MLPDYDEDEAYVHGWAAGYYGSIKVSPYTGWQHDLWLLGYEDGEYEADKDFFF